MKQQIFAIHGGDSFASYDEYLTNLRNWQMDIERARGRKDWKGNLAQDLGADYDVFLPDMPNKRNAKYVEWKIWFEKFIPFMEDGVILIGHSLGGCFLAKYLAEETLPKRIAATFLVAAPYDEAENPEFAKHLNDFAAPKDLAKLAAQGGKVFLYQSKDDPLVSFTELAKYSQALPGATVRTFEGRGHIGQEHFPEIIEDIKSV
jgi:predicted alpha/beta hydrolase family esterase